MIKDYFGNTFCGKFLYGYEAIERAYQSIESELVRTSKEKRK